MKKKFLTVILSLMLSTMLFACGMHEASENNTKQEAVSEKDEIRFVKMNSYKGSVDLLRGGSEESISEGMMLITEDSVAVGDDSICEILVDSDKHIMASSKSKFNIEANGNEKEGKVSIDIEEGEVLFAIDNELTDKSEFNVNTPNASLSIRETVVNVCYNPEEEKTVVIVTEGTVWADRDGEDVVIEAGNGAVISKAYMSEYSIDVKVFPIDEVEEKYPNVMIDKEIEDLFVSIEGISPYGETTALQDETVFDVDNYEKYVKLSKGDVTSIYLDGVKLTLPMEYHEFAETLGNPKIDEELAKNNSAYDIPVGSMTLIQVYTINSFPDTRIGCRNNTGSLATYKESTVESIDIDLRADRASYNGITNGSTVDDVIAIMGQPTEIKPYNDSSTGEHKYDYYTYIIDNYRIMFTIAIVPYKESWVNFPINENAVESIFVSVQ